MALTAEALLEACSEDQPCGEDLSYDSERSEIELAFESGGSSDPDAPEAVEIDWRPVLKQIEAQFSRTKDIWLAVYLCRAGARSGALEVVEVGAQTLAGLFERYWDGVHPTLDELGVPGRKAPCDALARRTEFLGPLERAILISHPRLGSYSGADVERFRSGGDGEDGYGMFRAALDDLGAEALQQALERLKSIEDGFRRADRVFTANANGEQPPNFSPTYEVLGRLQRGLTAFVPGADDAANDDAGADDNVGASSGGSAGAASGGGRLSGKVDSREDVTKAIDAIMDYYRRREPSSPVPLALERAKAWVTLDFMSVLKDIAPDGVDEATKVLVRRAEDDD
jgi:type VI secretion system protein ImpA